MRTKPLLPIGWKFVSILTIFGGGQSQHPLCGLTNNYLPRGKGRAYSHVISSCLVKKSFIISKMEEVDMDLCQRKSRSPLQWPVVDENDHSGQKHEEDFSREESNVMEHISRNHMQPSQLSGKSYFICNDKQYVFEKFVRETMNKPDKSFPHKRYKKRGVRQKTFKQQVGC